MRSDLHHLPERQQRELERVRDTLLAGFEAAKNGGGGGTQEWRRGGMILKIILFGSYARGDQKKRSDVDFLVMFDEPVSYLDLGGLKIFMEEITGVKSHVVPSYNLRPEFRDNVLSEVKYIE